MKIEHVKIRNFKAIKDMDVSLDGKSVYLIGGNRTGKTTFIQAIYAALTGKELPPDPITTGKDSGDIDIEIGDGTEKLFINVHFTQANPKGTLSVRTSEDGNKLPSPRALLEDIAGRVSFDPFDFLNMDGKKQVEFIKKLVGLDFTALDKRYAETFAERTGTNRDINNLKGKLAESDIAEHEVKLFTEEKDLTAIQDEIQAANEHNMKVAQGEEKLKTLQTEMDGKVERRNKITEELKELQARLETLDAERKDIEAATVEIGGKIETGRAWVEANKPKDLEALNARFKDALAFNNKVKAVSGVKADIEKRDSLEQLSKDYAKQLAEIDDERRRMIAEAPMPVPGLGFTDECLTVDGLPFDERQISTSKIIEVGIKIMMAVHPKLKICRIKNASLLDGKTFNELLGHVQEEGYQAFVEIVQHDAGELKVEIIEE